LGASTLPNQLGVAAITAASFLKNLD